MKQLRYTRPEYILYLCGNFDIKGFNTVLCLGYRQFIKISRRYIAQDGKGSLYAIIYYAYIYNKYFILYYVIIYYIILYYYESRLRLPELDNGKSQYISRYFYLINMLAIWLPSYRLVGGVRDVLLPPRIAPELSCVVGAFV